MKKKGKICLFSGLILCILISIFLIGRGRNEKKQTTFHGVEDGYYEIEERVEKVKTTKVEDRSSIGWVRVQGTNIDYPIIGVQLDSLDNFTWISPFYFSGDTRKVIYGHNMRNVSNEPLVAEPTHTRFEQLMSFANYNFAKDNLYIQVTEDGENHLYKIFAVGFYSVEEEIGNSYSNENLSSYISNAEERSIYKYDIEVKDADDIISLITCTRFYGYDGKTQFRVDARRIREGEKTNQYLVIAKEGWNDMEAL